VSRGIDLDRQINRSGRSMVISSCKGRSVRIFSIVVEFPHLLLAVDLIFNLLDHSQLRGLNPF